MALRDRAEDGRRLLDRYLFPEPAAAAPGPARWEKAGLVTALLALGVVLQLARIGWTGSLNALWAEDGPIFVQEALAQGFGDAVSSEYSGYLVLVPRLIGEAAALMPLEGAAATVSILSALLIALSGLAVWHAAAAHIPDPLLRGALVLATVLTPVGGMESIDSASYVSWYMLFAVFWILLWRPRTLAGAAWGGLLIVATVLSNPGAWFLLPLAALRALAIRDRRDATIVGAYFAASVVQLVAMARSNYEAVEPLWTSDIWEVLVQRVVAGAAFGLRGAGGLWDQFGWPALIALTACMVLAFAIGLTRSDGRARAFALIAIPTALGMFVLSVYQRAAGTPMLWLAGDAGGHGGRYAIVPVLLVVATAMVVAEGWRRQSSASWKAWPSLAIAGLLLASVAVSYPAGDTAVRGTPAWDDALDAAAVTCASEGGEIATVATSPPGFQMALPCSEIPADSTSPPQR
jgi:hypothetical protein